MLQTFLSVVLALAMAQEQAPSVPAAAPEKQNLRISGTVVSAGSGQPIAHALVIISAQGGRAEETMVTAGEDGRFAFENLSEGKYSLLARRKGYLQQFYKQHEQFSTAIVVRPDLNTENLRFEIHPEASIAGQVTDEMNEPVRHAQVMLFRSALTLGRRRMEHTNMAQTDDLGRFRFGHLTPASYFVAVSARPWYAQRPVHQRMETTDGNGRTTTEDVTVGEPELDVTYPLTFFPNAKDIAEAAPITVKAGDAETADLRLQPAPSLHVTVRTPSSGEAVEGESLFPQIEQTIAEGVQVGVSTTSQQISPGVTEISGLPAGRFSLRMFSTRKGASSERGQDLQVTGDTEVNLAEGSAIGSVSGTAKLDNGAPLTPAPMLELRARASGGEFTARADQNGEFTWKDQAIPAGVYDVLVPQPVAVAVKAMTASGAKVSGRSVEISAGQDVRLNIVLSQGTGQVTGFAMKDGKGAEGVMIVLVPEVPEHNLVLFRRDQSDSDGSFLLPGVHAGKYTVVAIEDGWETEWQAPGVLQRYLAGGQAVQVMANGKVDVQVKVQAR